MKASVLLMILVLALVQCSVRAADDEGSPPGDHGYWLRVAEALQASDNPQEQLLAAQLLGIVLWSHHPSSSADAKASPAYLRRHDYLQRFKSLRAQALESGDVIVLSMATQSNGPQDAGPSRATIAGRWQDADPENLAPRLYSDAPIEEVLAGSRDTTRYLTYGYRHLQLMNEAFSRLPMTGEEASGPGWKQHSSDGERAAVHAFGIRAALSAPAFQHVVNACKEPALSSSPQRAVDCLHVAKVMAQASDTLLSQRIGLAILRNSASTETDKAMSARLQRRHQWLWHNSANVLWDEADEREQVAQLLEVMRAPGVENELQLTEALMRKRGIPLLPPQDWKAPQGS